GLDVLGGMHQLEVGVPRRFGLDHLDFVQTIEPVGPDQRKRQENPLRTERMAGAMVVAGGPLAGDEGDLAAQSAARIAATVRSAISDASSSVTQKGGPSMIRSPFEPSACPVEE